MEARRKRRIVDNGIIDWVMVRNRMATIASNNARQVALSVSRLASELRFRVADGLHDRVIFREIENLVEALDLPGRTPGVEHLQARRLWHDRVAKHYRELGAADWRAG